MSERKKIIERLHRKEQEIATLEEKLKSAKVYVQALRDILKMLEATPEDDVEAEATLRAGSTVDQARRVILERGHPMHIDDILEAIGKEVTREAKSSLTSSLAAYVRRDEIFTRPAPNTFGLTELGHEAQDELEQVPPKNFGQMPKDPFADEEIPF